MTLSDAEYEAMVLEIVAKQERRAILDQEIRELQDQTDKIERERRGLPTVPGLYWHPEEGWPAVLDEDGWSDGWGDPLEEGDMDLENVKRVEFVDD
ncbi:hypothetical protein SEA_LIFES_84 [Microbacterium phage Lifes]|nr:hypothetical protein SEA_LIFES_84 [Microbacterium phage Lifes]